MRMASVTSWSPLAYSLGPDDKYDEPLPDELPGDKPTDDELEEGSDDPAEE